MESAIKNGMLAKVTLQKFASGVSETSHGVVVATSRPRNMLLNTVDLQLGYLDMELNWLL